MFPTCAVPGLKMFFESLLALFLGAETILVLHEHMAVFYTNVPGN